MRAAAIDIGTNSIKLALGEGDPAGLRVLHENVLITRLGQDLYAAGRISDEAARRTVEGICQLAGEARSAGATRIRAVATSAVRDAANRDEFLAAVREAAGVEIEVISGADEARLTQAAVRLDLVLGTYEGEQITLDVGGGSTEFTRSVSGAIGNRARSAVEAVSVDVGAVRLHEGFITGDPPSDEEMEAAASFAREALGWAVVSAPDARVVGVGGSAVNVARMLREVPCEHYMKVHGAIVTAAELRGLIEKLRGMRVEERRGLVGLDPERADVILPGAMILEAALGVLGREEMVVSVRGVRHGLLYEMLEVEI